MELKWMIRILATVAFFVGLDSLLVAPLLPAITETIRIPDGSGGLLITSYALQLWNNCTFIWTNV